MLETTTHRAPNKTLIAFEPRQVTLARYHTMKKNKTVSSETLDNGATLEALKSSKTKKKKNRSSTRDFSLLYQSIAAFLQHNGLSKTLDALRSEQSIPEVYGSNVPQLEIVFYHNLESSKGDSNSIIDVEALGLPTPQKNISEKDLEEYKCDAAADSKKKRKKSKGSDGGPVDEQPADEVTNHANGNEKSTDEVIFPPLKSHEKKKKSKQVSDYRKDDSEKVDPEISCDLAENAISEPQLDESKKKSKDTKKKKSKVVSGENDGQSTLEVLSAAAVDITADSAPLPDTYMETKKKKHKSKSESPAENIEQGTSEDINAVIEEKKGSKKRKRLTSEENKSQVDDENVTKDARKSNTEGSEDDQGYGQPLKANPLPGNGHVESKEFYNDQQQNGLSGCDDTEKDEREGSASQKKKQRIGSAEPKTVNAFQRVKVDKVEFADDRLQDNSYWAKDGADIGYGAKAQEVLGQVRGRDFRHEKTKKKRGSYRGGQIDLQSHSVKFNYSDEE